MDYYKSAKTKVFISFDYDHDVDLKNLLVGQAKNDDTPLVLYEILATPLTYVIVNKLKKVEGIDVYDRGISYNPFHLSEKV
jgi:hypothetical protein